MSWERHDRALERAGACVGCRRADDACVCPSRLPVRLRLVDSEPSKTGGQVVAFPLNNARPGICGPEAA